ncbi:MAG: DNA-binding transcriptional regulator Fis [Gammaproteobacteria bacterium]|nr:DNA-binding transcriptional regulator Fis [Gammaproteobacteria bacterium]
MSTTAEAALLETVFQVSAEKSHRPLRECIATALEEYFRHLDGHEPDDLYQMVLQEMEEPLLRAVLDYTRSNQSRAAVVLGLNRGTLRKKMKQYNLD